MRGLMLIAGVLIVAACDAGPPQLQPRAPVKVGETDAGQPIYQFRLTRSNALGVTPVSNAAIAARAMQICPQGYRELAREGQAERRVSGVIYTDVEVTILCN